MNSLKDLKIKYLSIAYALSMAFNLFLLIGIYLGWFA